MKSAFVWKLKNRFFVEVKQDGRVIDKWEGGSQKEAIDWIDEEHFDVQSLWIKTQ